MHTLVIVNNQLKPETKSVLEKYKRYFAKTFFYSGEAINGLKDYEYTLRRQEAFFVIDDNYNTLTDKQWKSIIIQSVLHTPIVFARKENIEQTIIYKHKLKQDIREIFIKPEFIVPTGVYILNPEIYRHLGNSIDESVKKLVNYKENKRGSKESNNILVCILSDK